MHEHLTFEVAPAAAAMGYTAYCYDCGQLFRDAAEADTLECRPTEDPRSHPR